MKNSNTTFDIMFLPIEMISSWKRASISSSFCSCLLNTKEQNTYLNNILSSTINECLEFAIKHGVKKSENYSLSCNQNNEIITINLTIYLLSQQIILLKNYIKKIQSINKNKDFEKTLFTKEFSELGHAIYSITNDFKGKIKIENKKNKEKKHSSILKTNIIIKLNNKDIQHDYQN